jgi:hypothetical protein
VEGLMLAGLQTVPETDEDWDRFAYWNWDANNQIRQAILAQKNIRLQEYQLQPIDFDHIDFWLNANAKAVNGWIFLNFQELFNACQTLRIGP